MLKKLFSFFSKKTGNGPVEDRGVFAQVGQPLSIDDILSLETDDEVCMAYSERLFARQRPYGPNAMTNEQLEHEFNEVELNFLVTYELEAEVNNGGFDQYFFNSAGNQSARAMTALEAMGARHIADVLRLAIQAIGGSAPSDRFERQSILADLSEEQSQSLNALDERFYGFGLAEAQAAYLRANINLLR